MVNFDWILGLFFLFLVLFALLIAAALYYYKKFYRKKLQYAEQDQFIHQELELMRKEKETEKIGSNSRYFEDIPKLEGIVVKQKLGTGIKLKSLCNIILR